MNATQEINQQDKALDALPDELLMVYGLIAESVFTPKDERKDEDSLKALDLLELYGEKLNGDEKIEKWRKKYKALVENVFNDKYDYHEQLERVQRMRKTLNGR